MHALLFNNSMQRLSFISQDFQISVPRWQVSLSVDSMEIPLTSCLILLSTLQAMELKQKQEHKFSFRFVTTVIAVLHPPLSMGFAF